MNFWGKSSRATKFTNVKCTSFAKEFADFEYCYLKSINRSYKYVSIRLNLFKTPVTKVKFNGALYKRYNGYRPFMYNITVDACRFLKDPTSNPVINYLFEFSQGYSNINGTCPINHDIIIDKLPNGFVFNRITKVLPFPEGDYKLATHWIAYDTYKAEVSIYGSLT
ncbi:uncharacterized protein LOC108086783 [Drosophila ficusphila]|uniref:uncharacterized protein LOC108086783 n=1 Tax=Drosophila ficusphila TaxID=30025 RepID=UPI0007E6EE87|nr:uncharacterized protein LOC108086783 [Drosophila ficusphila]